MLWCVSNSWMTKTISRKIIVAWLERESYEKLGSAVLTFLVRYGAYGLIVLASSHGRVALTGLKYVLHSDMLYG